MGLRLGGSIGKASPTLRVLGLLLAPRTRRARSHVEAEYEPVWSRYRGHLERAESLQEWLYVRGLDDLPLTHQLDGKVHRGSLDWVRFQMEHVARALAEHFPDARSVTEYGCGVGRNLLRLEQRVPDLRLYGYELFRSGVEIGQSAAEKFASRAR